MTVTADAASRRVVEPALATTRRLRGLAAIGWPAGHLAGELRVSPVTVRRLTTGQDRVTSGIAARIERLYDDLQHSLGPSPKTRIAAADRGYDPPAAWDGDTIADPSARPQAVHASLTAVPSPPASSSGRHRSARLPQPATAGAQHPLKSARPRDEFPCERDPEAWFPDSSDMAAIAAAKTGCSICPARASCLEFALASGQRWGVWGGLSEDERSEERRRRLRAS
jgi:hypothetical protein